MKEQTIIFENENQRIEAILNTPDNKTDTAIILAHGFTGNRNGPDDVYVKLANKLTENGFAVLRFNFRFTDPETWKDFEKMTINGEVSDLKAAVDFLKKSYKKIGVVGESLGGAVTILAYDNKVDYVVLWYPAIFPADTPSFKRLEGREDEINKKGYLVIEKKEYGTRNEIRIGQEFYYERKNLRIIDFVRNIKAPLLMVSGDKDTAVPHIQSEKAFEVANEPKKLEIVHDANHCWRNADGVEPNLEYQQKAIKLTVDWFNRWLK